MAENTLETSPDADRNRKLLMAVGAVLIIGVFALVVFGLILAFSLGWIGGGTDMIVGFPDQDESYDIYLLEMGQPADEGVRLAREVQIGEYAIYVFQDLDYSKMIWGAGFVPDSSYVFLAYQDNGDAVFEQMEVRGDQPEDLFNTNDYPVLIAFPDQKNVVIIEYSDDEARCYLAPFGEEADRVARGTDCIILPDGETLVVVEEDDGEYTFTALEMASGDENKFLELDGSMDMYQVSSDGSLMAYVEDTGDEQELHVVRIKDGEDEKIAEGSRIPDFGFAQQSNDFYFLVEDQEGYLSLYVNEENDPIAEGLMVAAQFDPAGEYLIFSEGDELDDIVVYSYSLRDEEAEEIADGEGLEFAVVADPAQVVVIEFRDDGDLTVYSSSLDGEDVIEVLDERDVLSWDSWTVPGHEFLYFVLWTEDGAFAYAYQTGGEGFFFVEEWADVYLLNVSPNGKYLAFSGSEDTGDDPILFYVELEAGSEPVELDDEAEWFVNAVFSKNSRELLYTLETGSEADEVSVSSVVLADGSPETLYEEAYLLDVEWADLAPFDYLNFAYMTTGESYCPGAISLAANDPVDVLIGENETVCFRFYAGAGEVWHLDIDTFTENLDLEATLLDNDGVYLSYNDDGLYDLDPWLAYHFDQGGVYFLEVADIEGATGDFMISLIEGEDSFSAARPYSLGESVQGTITERSLIYLESPEFGDEPVGGLVGEVFRVEMEGNVPVSFYAYIDGSYEIGLALLDENGEWVEEGHSEAGAGEAIIEVAPFSSGTYYLLLVILDEETEPEYLNVNFELYSEESGGVSGGFIGEIDFGQTESGDLANGTQDEWQFYAEVGENVVITLESSEFDAYLELYDPDGTLVAEDDDSGGDRNSEIDFVLEATGYYSIMARAYGDSGEGVYLISLDRAEEPAPEPTQQPTSGGGEIEIDDIEIGYLAEGAQDAWTFDADAGTTITIELESEDFDCVLELLDDNGIELAYDDDSGGAGDSLIEEFTLDASGTFTIIARAYNNIGSGDYVLSLFGVDDIASDIEYDDVISGTLSADGEDYWTFSGDEGDTVTITLESLDFDAILTLLDEDGFEVAYDDDGGGDRNALIWNFVLAETGDYTIVVSAFSVEGAGNYTLTIKETVIVITGTISYGGTINSTIDLGERQVWSFDGSDGDVVTIAAESSDFDTFLELRDDFGSVLTDDDDSGDDTNSLIEAFTLEETGTYWIVVRDYRSERSGDFTLTLDLD